MNTFATDFDNIRRLLRRFCRVLASEFSDLSDDAMAARFRDAMARAADRLAFPADANDEATPTEDVLVTWQSLATRLAALPASSSREINRD
jgi:hypothetical protein